jgi:hypothetical protein
MALIASHNNIDFIFEHAGVKEDAVADADADVEECNLLIPHPLEFHYQKRPGQFDFAEIARELASSLANPTHRALDFLEHKGLHPAFSSRVDIFDTLMSVFLHYPDFYVKAKALSVAHTIWHDNAFFMGLMMSRFADRKAASLLLECAVQFSTSLEDPRILRATLFIIRLLPVPSVYMYIAPMYQEVAPLLADVLCKVRALAPPALWQPMCARLMETAPPHVRTHTKRKLNDDEMERVNKRMKQL